jgi:hypothetical protein
MLPILSVNSGYFDERECIPPVILPTTMRKIYPNQKRNDLFKKLSFLIGKNLVYPNPGTYLSRTWILALCNWYMENEMYLRVDIKVIK